MYTISVDAFIARVEIFEAFNETVLAISDDTLDAFTVELLMAFEVKTDTFNVDAFAIKEDKLVVFTV